MGWDAFGLPAEQYAIKTGQHPRITTEQNISNFRRQLKTLGAPHRIGSYVLMQTNIFQYKRVRSLQHSEGKTRKRLVNEQNIVNG